MFVFEGAKNSLIMARYDDDYAVVISAVSFSLSSSLIRVLLSYGTRSPRVLWPDDIIVSEFLLLCSFQLDVSVFSKKRS